MRYTRWKVDKTKIIQHSVFSYCINDDFHMPLNTNIFSGIRLYYTTLYIDIFFFFYCFVFILTLPKYHIIIQYYYYYGYIHIINTYSVCVVVIESPASTDAGSLSRAGHADFFFLSFFYLLCAYCLIHHHCAAVIVRLESSRNLFAPFTLYIYNMFVHTSAQYYSACVVYHIRARPNAFVA